MEVIRKLVRNPNFAKSKGDKMATTMFVVGGMFAFWYETYHVMPGYKLSSFWQTFNFIVAAWCYVSAMTNWFLMISTRVFPFYGELQDKKDDDWTYCQRCFIFCPPRSHHCKVCNVCVLKRDHHCWFTGTCVGFRNHRYYVSMLMYIWIAALYSNLFNLVFLYEVMGGFGIGTVFSIFFPHGAALVGLLTFYQFCVSAITFLGLLCLVMFSWLLQIQISQIYYGQTKHEKKHQITDYNLGWSGNVEEILGHRGYLTMLSAFLPSKLPGDGVRFSRIVKDR